jgi:hypothetical protein
MTAHCNWRTPENAIILATQQRRIVLARPSGMLARAFRSFHLTDAASASQRKGGESYWNGKTATPGTGGRGRLAASRGATRSQRFSFLLRPFFQVHFAR